MNPLSFAVTPSPAQGSGAATGAAARDTADGGSFDNLLQAPKSPESSPAPAQSANKSEGKSSATTADGDGGKRTDDGKRADDAAEPADAKASVEKPTQAARPETKQKPEADDDLPWPPPGLSGLPVATTAPAAPALASADVMPQTGVLDPKAAANLLGADVMPQAGTLEGAAKPAPALAAAVMPQTGTPLPQAGADAAHGATNAATLAPTPAPEQAALDAIARLATDAGQAALPAHAEISAPTLDANTAAAFGSLLHTFNSVGELSPAPPFPDALAAPADLQAADFDEAIGARVSWLADQKIGHAHIRVTPHDMGAVDVRLQLDGDRVHASFSSAHADVRHALESSLPKLREMLGEQGLELAQADVGQQQSDPRAAAGNGDGTGTGNGEGPALSAADADGDLPVQDNSPALQQVRLRSLLDAYA